MDICFSVDTSIESDRQVADIIKTISHISWCRREQEGSNRRVWVSFHGFDGDDKREIWEIPECIEWTKKFMRALINKSRTDVVSYMSVLGDDRLDTEPKLGVGLSFLLAMSGMGEFKQLQDGVFDVCLTHKGLEYVRAAHGDIQ